MTSKDELFSSQSERIVSNIADDGNFSPRSISTREKLSSERVTNIELITQLNEETADHIISPVNRAKSLKEQFIEVYVGSQVFADAGLNVVIAIFLQATDRLYEIVLVNKDTAEELHRLYVYEDELIVQMKKRHEALWIIPTENDGIQQAPNRKSRRGSLGGLKSTPSSTTQSNTSQTDAGGTPGAPRRDSTLSVRRGSVEQPSRRGSVEQPSRRGSTTGALSLCASALSVSEQESANASLAYRNNLQKDTELAKMTQGSSYDSTLLHKAPPVARPVVYFGLLAGSKIMPPLLKQYQKVGKSDLLRDFRVRADDLSAVEVKDISFFTAVILSSLYVRRMAQGEEEEEEEENEPMRFQFVLFDGM